MRRPFSILVIWLALAALALNFVQYIDASPEDAQAVPTSGAEALAAAGDDATVGLSTTDPATLSHKNRIDAGWIDGFSGKGDVRINCPSIGLSTVDAFSPALNNKPKAYETTTVLCEGCNAIVDTIVFAAEGLARARRYKEMVTVIEDTSGIVRNPYTRDARDPLFRARSSDPTTKHLCHIMYENLRLRQRTNGLRFWAHYVGNSVFKTTKGSPAARRDLLWQRDSLHRAYPEEPVPEEEAEKAEAQKLLDEMNAAEAQKLRPQIEAAKRQQEKAIAAGEAGNGAAPTLQLGTGKQLGSAAQSVLAADLAHGDVTSRPPRGMAPYPLGKPHVEEDYDLQMLYETHLVRADGRGTEGINGLPVTYHSPHERRTLPCASYLLKRTCQYWTEQNDDKVERCLRVASQAARFYDEEADAKELQRKNAHLPKLGGSEAHRRAADAATAEEEDNGEVKAKMWPSELRNCLIRTLRCESRWCQLQPLLKAQEQELERHMMYEAAFGNPKFQYVVDPSRPGRNMKNPYAVGGSKHHLNAWLNGTWPKIESLDQLQTEDL